jgi:HEAT repeat protein
MDRLLRNFDRTSFWLGFLAGFLFLWLLGRLKPLVIQGFTGLRQKISAARLAATASADVRLRNEALLRAQSMHMASSLFSLDEILVTPRLMQPPPLVQPGVPPPEEEVANSALPYMPDWPEAAAIYRAPTVDLAEALQDGASLVVVGLPGSGKSVALADLASRIARREELPGGLEQLTPLLVHAADFHLHVDEGQSGAEQQPVMPEVHPESKAAQIESNPASPSAPLLSAIKQNAAMLTQARLPDFLELALNEGQALLLLDGMDELPRPQADALIGYLKLLKGSYPALRMVVTASLEYTGELSRLGCFTMAMAAWDTLQRAEYIQRWSGLWARHIDTPTGTEADVYKDARRMLLAAWLLREPSFLTPLELTLKVWAAFAGDQRGSSMADAVEAYLRRMSFDKNLQPIPHAREAAQQMALQMVMDGAPFWSGSRTRQETNLSDELLPTSDLPTDGEQVEPAPESQPAPDGGRKVKIASVVPSLLENGLLIQSADSRVRFKHLEVCAYLAGSAFGELLGLDAIFSRSEWLQKPAWDTQIQAMAYFLANNDHTPATIDRYLGCDSSPLHQHVLTAARWLRSAPLSIAWRNAALRRLVGILQVEELSASLRGRAMVAMVLSGTSGVQTMLRQMSKSEDAIQRQLAALGAGLYYDDKIAADKAATDALVEMCESLLSDDYQDVRRAACLALVAIGNKPALDAIADALLTADEDLRRYAAEALANDTEEGYPTLREGATIDDVLVRRAVVQGLKRVRQPWAIETLQKMQLEDAQWVVQNAAGHALEQLEQKAPGLPQLLPPLTQTPWLIAFAGELGIGVSPGKPAYELVLRALKQGNLEQRLAALDYLRVFGDEIAAREIDVLSREEYGELREAAYNTLWHLSAAGMVHAS